MREGLGFDRKYERVQSRGQGLRERAETEVRILKCWRGKQVLGATEWKRSEGKVWCGRKELSSRGASGLEKQVWRGSDGTTERGGQGC